jgi:hypothetical protein
MREARRQRASRLETRTTLFAIIGGQAHRRLAAAKSAMGGLTRRHAALLRALNKG